jgi:hypothetical protein
MATIGCLEEEYPLWKPKFKVKVKLKKKCPWYFIRFYILFSY